jgi:hypothetical protein
MADKNDDRLRGDLTRLVGKDDKAATKLPPADAVSPIPSKEGFSPPKKRDLNNKNLPASTGGIASPLTETAFADREYYADTTVLSSDGIFSFTVKRIKTITMKDKNSGSVKLVFKEPEA